MRRLGVASLRRVWGVPRAGVATDAAASTTHFGFQTVPFEAKQGKVNDVFHSVADK